MHYLDKSLVMWLSEQISILSQFSALNNYLLMVSRNKKFLRQLTFTDIYIDGEAIQSYTKFFF